jgi:hypothetical protein
VTDGISGCGLNVVCCETAIHPKSAPKRKWLARAQNVADDPLATLSGGSTTYAFIRNPATSSVLSCLVPSLGGANETALQSRWEIP